MNPLIVALSLLLLALLAGGAKPVPRDYVLGAPSMYVGATWQSTWDPAREWFVFASNDKFNFCYVAAWNPTTLLSTILAGNGSSIHLSAPDGSQAAYGGGYGCALMYSLTDSGIIAYSFSLSNGRHIIISVSATAPHALAVAAGVDGQFGADEGVGAAARLDSPAQMCTHRLSKYTLVADMSNFRMRSLVGAASLTLGVSNVAGKGVQGGEDGAALNASFNDPWSCVLLSQRAAVPAAAFINEDGVLRVRRLTPVVGGGGVVSTIISFPAVTDGGAIAAYEEDDGRVILVAFGDRDGILLALRFNIANMTDHVPNGTFWPCHHVSPSVNGYAWQDTAILTKSIHFMSNGTFFVTRRSGTADARPPTIRVFERAHSFFGSPTHSRSASAMRTASVTHSFAESATASATTSGSRQGTASPSPTVSRTKMVRPPLRLQPLLRGAVVMTANAMAAAARGSPAMAIYRMRGVSGLSACGTALDEADIDDVGPDSNPLGLEIGDKLPNHVGAMLGNPTLVISITLALRAAAFALAWRKRISHDEATAVIRCPWSVAVLVYVVGPPTFSSVATTIVMGSVTPWTVVLWAIDCALFGLLPVCVFATILPKVRALTALVAKAPDRPTADPPGDMTRLKDYVFGEWGEWKACDFVQRYGGIFEGFSHPYFCAVDYTTACIIGVLDGVSLTCQGKSCCVNIAAVCVVVAAVHLLVCLYMRPCLTRFDIVFNGVATVSTQTVAALQLRMHVSLTQLADINDALEIVETFSTILLVVGVLDLVLFSLGFISLVASLLQKLAPRVAALLRRLLGAGSDDKTATSAPAAGGQHHSARRVVITRRRVVGRRAGRPASGSPSAARDGADRPSPMVAPLLSASPTSSPAVVADYHNGLALARLQAIMPGRSSQCSGVNADDVGRAVESTPVQARRRVPVDDDDDERWGTLLASVPAQLVAAAQTPDDEPLMALPDDGGDLDGEPIVGEEPQRLLIG